GQGFFYHQLVKGKIKWVNIDDNGKEFIQCIIGEGESFGELPLLDDGPYVATSVALEDSVLLRLRKETFLQLLRENPKIHFRFTRLMTERLRLKFIFLKELSNQDPERKVVTILNHYKEDADSCFPGRHRINLTRQQIANMTGLRVETVIRTIKSLEEEGRLVIDKGKVFC
ncbi:MAG: Crp/Fnr family transcriptional regulator, partial [Chitinophagaceae bacterium]|nr:Crp/Fnr family transcriptional regulator [Chitinophagaceae bacterium]